MDEEMWKLFFLQRDERIQITNFAGRGNKRFHQHKVIVRTDESTGIANGKVWMKNNGSETHATQNSGIKIPIGLHSYSGESTGNEKTRTSTIRLGRDSPKYAFPLRLADQQAS